MLHDFLLAAAHHLLAFGLVAMLVTQSVLLGQTTLDAPSLRRVSGVDMGLGLTAGLLLAIGLARVFHGIKGAEFYLHNPWFHAKLGAFVLAAALSLVPTLRFVRWRRAMKADAAWLPPSGEVAAMRRIVRIELLLIAVILVAAAGMARHGGLGL